MRLEKVLLNAEILRTSPFAALGLIEPLVRAVHDEGYTTPTPIQREVIPSLVAARDVLGCAQTGTGKTAAFVLPILQQLVAEGRGKSRSPSIRALVLSPTRELAAQIGERIGAYGKHLGLKHAVVFGGVGQRPQEVALRGGLDILVATPGRLLDLMQQRHARLNDVAYLVLDEADRMLDMGFIHDVKRIVAAVPKQRQTLLFSATMPKEVMGLANSMLHDPVRVAIEPKVTSAVLVEQSVMFVQKADKRAMLETVLLDPEVSRAIVFMRTKHGANRLAYQLEKAGIDAAAIHGNKSQGARERALSGFKDGSCRVLIATDVASRGIDVDDISHVINYELPDTPESYVHRIGRTGRAGATGRAISFCDPSERRLLQDIERLLGRRITVHGDVSIAPSVQRQDPPPPPRAPRPQGGGGRGGGSRRPQAGGGSRHGSSGSSYGSSSGGPRPSHPRPAAASAGSSNGTSNGSSNGTSNGSSNGGNAGGAPRVPVLPGDSTRKRRPRRF